MTILLSSETMTDQRQLRLARQASRRAALEQRARRQRLTALGAGVALAAATLIAVPIAASGGDPAPVEAAAPSAVAATVADIAESVAGSSSWGTPGSGTGVDTADLSDADAPGAQPVTDASADAVAEAEGLRDRAAELPVLSEGDSGAVIAIAQQALGVEATGYFGPLTKAAVVDLQSGLGLPSTGMVATYTWSALGSDVVAKAEVAAGAADGYTDGEPPAAEQPAAEETAAEESGNVVAAGTSSADEVGDPPVLERTDVGQAVAVLQKALGISPGQGTFGPNTERVVKEFQRDNGIPTTGVVATLTWAALGEEVSRAAAIAHAKYGTDFGAAASSGNSGGGGGGGNSGGGNSGGGSGSGGGNSGGGTNSIAGRFCPVKNFTWGQGLGAPRPGGRLHAGVDMMGKRGEPIYAVDSGTVTRSGYQSNGALILDITGSKGMWFYGHFDSIKFSVGDRVQAGQVIGYMGDTGSPGAVHLHIELRPYGWSGGASDPLPLLKQLCA